jgi:tetratricopeptide (TPR) repeat protein
MVKVMKVLVLTLLAAAAALASDQQQLALLLRAQTDFDRVMLPAVPQLRDTAACIQSEAALAPVAPPEEQAQVHFRKGYCTLAGAAITGEAAGFRAAAAEFDQAGVPVLAGIARLEAHEPAPDLAKAGCSAAVMSPQLCQQWMAVGREWLGWEALRQGDLDAAARDLSAAPGWSAWVAGQQAFRGGQYAAAATDDRNAIGAWQSRSANSLRDRLAPPVDLGEAYTALGGAQLLAGDPAAAIASLTQAAKENPANARAFYLRARAQEISGHPEAAEADYSLASRAAFAGAKDLASGEAHLYRGILLYRRRQYEQAEDEFASALNFDIPAALRADASAWRRLSAVISGSCGASRAALEQAIPSVSPYFPKDEARAALAACGSLSSRP